MGLYKCVLGSDVTISGDPVVHHLVHSSESSPTLSSHLIVSGILLFFQHQRADVRGHKDTLEALATGSWQTRVTALKRCREKSVDVLAMTVYPELKDSKYIPVRYWLVEAFIVSGHPRADDELIEFLDDPGLNVRCRACAALGQRGDPRKIGKLLFLLQEPAEWYLQMYAYKALKALGWNQTVSE